MATRIEIQSNGNAAFEDEAAGLIYILRETADRIEQFGLGDKRIFDINGNQCGTLTVVDDD